MTEFLKVTDYLKDETKREREKNEIHKMIHNVDDKHEKNHYDLKLTIMTFIESQKPLNEHMQGIRKDLQEVNGVLIEYAKKTDDLTKDFEVVKNAENEDVLSRNKLLSRILIASLGAGGAVPVLIQFFFR
ncbi:hypothetical protein [Staphylococcus chromogenes]|uniref:hypothetical protein n=1 Tax=Staphylococcus chromogenes TaxID=46126 RepID=UPI000E68840C|nr:hypothetical protein [Staphylococcus chromogenes]RIM01332.1 hypothetical protein BU683_11260 [Staphylococcus chromogenes]